MKLSKENWDRTIVPKSIKMVEDALKCIEVGVQGIRHQGGGVRALSVLPTIVDAVWEELEIFFESGIRCEADIAKALALGV